MKLSEKINFETIYEKRKEILIEPLNQELIQKNEKNMILLKNLVNEIINKKWNIENNFANEIEKEIFQMK